MNPRCIVCDSTDQWKNADEYRIKPVGMAICQKCGFVTYPEIISNKKKLEDYYVEDYRKPPTFENLCTGQTKLQYHSAFLTDLFNQWKERKVNPVIFEVGAAFGMFLSWVKNIFPEGDVSGSELTRSYVRVAYHSYGLELKADFDESKKYDLITSYKVLEHQPDADLELKRYAKCLKSDGLLYISVPIWFDRLSNFGTAGFDLEYYYHKNHINAWSMKNFKAVLAKTGFEIVKENHVYYDSTFLCRYTGSSIPIEHDNAVNIEEKMVKIRDAFISLHKNEPDKALALYPNFPEGHTHRYEHGRAKFDKQGFEWIEENVIQKALTDCPGSSHAQVICADIYMRYRRHDKALHHLDQALQMKPNDATILINMGHCFRQLAALEENAEEKYRLYHQAAKVSSAAKLFSKSCERDATTWMMDDFSNIPTPFEKT